MTVIANPAQFALAGNARFTLVSKKTGQRFTFKVACPSTNQDGGPLAKENATIHFVHVLTGPDNTSDYRYLGYLRRGVYFHGGQKAKISRDAPSARAFEWFWVHTVRGDLNSDLIEVHHEGMCGRCGRALTVPESIQSGFGPECIGKV